MISTDEALLANLSPFSQRFAARFLGRYPGFREHARLEPQDDSSYDALLVEIPPPEGGSAALYVDTFNDEVTVTFERWASHFGFLPAPWAETSAFDRAIACVADIMTERLAVAIRLNAADECAGAITFRPGEDPPPFSTSRTYTRSWCGNHDAGWRPSDDSF